MDYQRKMDEAFDGLMLLVAGGTPGYHDFCKIADTFDVEVADLQDAYEEVIYCQLEERERDV